MVTLFVGPDGNALLGGDMEAWDTGGATGFRVVATEGGQLVQLPTDVWEGLLALEGRARTFRLSDNALHEAGHAVAGWAMGRTVKRVSVVPCLVDGGLSLGQAEFTDLGGGGDADEVLREVIAVRLAGTVATAREGITAGIEDARDLAEAESIAHLAHAGSGSRSRSLLRTCRATAAELLDQHWPVVKRLQLMLTDLGEVGSEQFMAAAREASSAS